MFAKLISRRCGTSYHYTRFVVVVVVIAVMFYRELRLYRFVLLNKDFISVTS